MGNILDFLDWFGDIPFEQVPFCEADALVLAQFSYVRLEDIVPSEDSDDTITVAEAAEVFKNLYTKEKIYEKSGFVSPLSPFVLFKMAEGRRWKDKKLSHMANRLNADIHEQFTALCIEINDDLHYLSFRGTDASVMGWKEDFMMTFTEVPAQKDASDYCNILASRMKGKFMLGGHSKGGNLAVYGLACAKPETQERIETVWCMDGPGFSSKVLPRELFDAVSDKVKLFIPQFCMVGELMNQSTPSIIVKSDEKGAFQHDALSWQIKGTKLERAGVRDPNSVKLTNIANHFIKVRKPEERMKVIDAFFSLFTNAGIESLDDFKKFDPAKIKKFIKTLSQIDNDDKAAITQLAIAVIVCSTSSSLNSVGDFFKFSEHIDAIADKQDTPYTLEDFEIWKGTKALRGLRSNIQKAIQATPFSSNKHEELKVVIEDSEENND